VIDKNNWISYSRHGEDKYLDNLIFNNFKNGYFVNIGAHDGLTYDNTLRFEKYHQWTGINIEPHKSIFKALTINRPSCSNLNTAVTNKDGTYHFSETRDNELAGLSLIPNTFQKKENNDIVNLEIDREVFEIYKIRTTQLSNIFNEHAIKKINLLVIDVPDWEFEIIKSINFTDTYIDVIMLENNKLDYFDEIEKNLNQNNFFIFRQAESIFFINISSRFNVFKQKSFQLRLRKLIRKIFS
jgi:FkbM family methyltransferase